MSVVALRSSIRQRGGNLFKRATMACVLALAAGVVFAALARAGTEPVPVSNGDACAAGARGCANGAAAPADLLLPEMREPVIPKRKRAWEASLGGEEAARPHVQARLAGWPQRFLADKETLPSGDREFLERVARDTWRGLDALRDRENGLPVDNVRLSQGSVSVADSRVGDYTSPTNIGLQLVVTVAAVDLQLLPPEAAVARIDTVLRTLEQLETFHGLFFNFYDTTSLERTSNFVSFVDSSWLTAGLIVVRNAFPELRARASALVDRTDYRLFYNRELQRISHGYYVNLERRSPFDYGVLFTEARLGSLIAIGKGDIPPSVWFTMVRTFPTDCQGQTMVPVAIASKIVDGFPMTTGVYDWGGLRYVPSWGGSMFEALMPTLVLDEQRYAPRSLGANGRLHAVIQQRYAREQLGYPVWGMSPSATPLGNGYGEYGVRVLGSFGYSGGTITPHASALALGVLPEAATANLRTLVQRYDVYGDFGFYDAVDPWTGTVAPTYLALDQSMLFIAIANYLGGGVIPKRFAADSLIQPVLPMIGKEDFFDGAGLQTTASRGGSTSLQ
jgi:hypothetical protein